MTATFVPRQSRRRFLSTDLPFWLLIAAWLCANIPSTATIHAFVWLNGARHFSHYTELRQNVAELLTGQPRALPMQLATADTSRQSPPPSLPANDNVKKIDLSLSPASLQLIATQVPAERDNFCTCAPDGPVADIPYPPPRVRGEV